MKSYACFIIRARSVVETILRLASVLLVLVGFLWFIVEWLLFVVVDQRGMQFQQFYGDQAIYGVAVVAAGGLLFMLSESLARLIVRVNDNECPKCRFSFKGIRADRCPECGLYLGPDFHAPPPAPSEPEP